jgi:hypothetical protein
MEFSSSGECEARQSAPIHDNQDDEELIDDYAKAYQRIKCCFESKKTPWCDYSLFGF